MKGKTYVLSDIHGNFEIFKRMLDKIQFNSHDQLYILGDICDRGPCSLDIYFYIQKFDNITLLKGNHEYMMQEALKPLITMILIFQVVNLSFGHKMAEKKRLKIFANIYVKRNCIIVITPL